MLVRVDDFFEFFAVDETLRLHGERAAAQAAEKANGMTRLEDYEALAAIALCFRPSRIFEIGTHLGITSDFFLGLLPECHVISICYQNPLWRFLGRSCNNSRLPKEKMGSEVSDEHRSRFTQIYGDSHKLNSNLLLKDYGRFDLVFIDGDHSHAGVSHDTELAKEIISDSGIICWHDANPKPKYLDVRQYLEDSLPLTAVATADTYTGGIACWNKDVEKMLSSVSK
jgi:hypothetical protein